MSSSDATGAAWFTDYVYLPLHTDLDNWINSPLGGQVDGFINEVSGQYLIGNGADGTAADPNGGNGGLWFGDGGDGYGPSGDGGNAGLFGNGGNAGDATDDGATLSAASGLSADPSAQTADTSTVNTDSSTPSASRPPLKPPVNGTPGGAGGDSRNGYRR